MNRRQLLAAAAAVGLGLRSSPAEAAAQPPPLPAPHRSTLADGLSLVTFQTGWVSVKRSHRSHSGPSALRIPAILFDTDWTEWLPIKVFVILHREEIIVVDTGESARMLSEPDYAACDFATGIFYRANLRFALDAQMEIGPQMRRFGIDPERVRTVVLTHLHSDHIGGMGHFPNARFVLSPRAARGHVGALMCRLPTGAALLPTVPTGASFGHLGPTAPLTRDAAVALVETDGHAAGHASVLVRSRERSWLLAGDAAFSTEQIETGRMAGIVEDWEAARATLSRLRAQMADHGTVVLPTHDPQAGLRLLDR